MSRDQLNRAFERLREVIEAAQQCIPRLTDADRATLHHGWLAIARLEVPLAHDEIRSGSTFAQQALRRYQAEDIYRLLGQVCRDVSGIVKPYAAEHLTAAERTESQARALALSIDTDTLPELLETWHKNDVVDHDAYELSRDTTEGSSVDAPPARKRLR